MTTACPRNCAACALLLITAWGCAPKDGGFGSVREMVRERTGAEVRWRRGEQGGDGAADGRAHAILARPMSAESAVQVALLRNQELQAAFEEIGIARAELVGATLPPNPEVEARVEFVQGSDAEHGGRPDLELAATQELTGLIFLPMRRGAADAELQAARLRAAGAALELAFTVRVAFYDYQAAEQLLTQRRAIFEAAVASWELAQKLHEAGNTTDLDLANERAFYEEARLAVANAEVAALQRREVVNRLMGLSGADTTWRAAGMLPEAPEELPDFADIERRAIERSLDLRELEARYTAAARRANVAQAQALLPELRAGIVAEREEHWELGPAVSMAVPIFDWGQGRVGIAEAEMRRFKALYTARGVRVRSEVRAARDRLVTLARAATHYAQVLVPLRAHIVAETLRQYNAMQVGAFELIAAKEAEAQTSRDYVAVLRDYWRARATLDQLLAGRLASATDADMDIAGAAARSAPSAEH